MFLGGEQEDDLRERQRCTDPLCCVGFIVAIVAFCGLYCRALVTGNIGKLYHGIDHQERICGVDAGVEDQPYLYWCMKSQMGGIPEVSMKNPICVGACPGENTAGTGESTEKAGQMYGIEPDCAAVAGAGSMASYKTTLVMHRFCLPDPSAYPSLSEKVASTELGDWTTTAVESASSIASAWPVLLGAFFISVMLGYLYLVLLRHCAETLIYLTMFGTVAGFGILGIYLFMNAGNLRSQLSNHLGKDVAFPPEISRHEELMTQVAAGLCFLLSSVTVCMACCFHHSIEVGSKCIEVACDTIFELPSLLLLPVVKAFFKGILAFILLLGFIELWSSAPISDGSDGLSPHLEPSDEQRIEILFYMLISFWILTFVNAVYQFVVAYGVAEYYYTPYDHDGEKDVGCCALWDGLYFGLITHGGSLAFGSLLIAILMVFQKIIHHLKKQNEFLGGNQVVECVLNAAMCCVACCKEIVEFIDKNAYIDIALTSSNFCGAAQDAVAMIIELGGAMAILNGATFVFAIFGTALISLASAGFTYVVCTQGTFADQGSQFDVAHPMAPAVLGFLIGGLVAMSFMHVFDMTSDTLLYCYGYDLKHGKGSPHAPAALKELVHG